MKITMPDGELKGKSVDSILLEVLLDDLDISMSEVLVVRNSEVIPEDCILEDDDEIRIIQVVFGG